MASLLVVGNTRPHTFVNAILAAEAKAREHDKRGLDDIFVLHSPESERVLGAQYEWREALTRFPECSVNPELLTCVTVDLSRDQNSQLDLAARHVERFLRTLHQHDDVYVDLTNGTSHYKSVLANIAFVIGAQRPYFVNISALPNLKSDHYWNLEQLRATYTPLPTPSRLDHLAPVWLTEIRRFHEKAEAAADVFCQLSSEPEGHRHIGFRDDIRNAIDAWFKGERNDDSAALDGAVRYIGMAFETMVRAAYGSLYPERKVGRKTTHEMLAQIRGHLAGIATDYDPDLLEDTSQLLKRLRNASSHERHATEFARLRARLATELLLGVTHLFGILRQRGLLSPEARSVSSGNTTPCGIQGRPGDVYFFGFDGDDTGRELERLFQGDSESDQFSRFSKSVDEAMKGVEKMIRAAPIHGEVLFCSGDDLFFKGCYDPGAIDAARDRYSRLSGGHTCSVGFGRTPKEAYVALKMAKATPGKDAVMGVEILPLNRPPM